MIRLVLLFGVLAVASIARAQETPVPEKPAPEKATLEKQEDLSALRQAAEQAAAGWEALAKGLDQKIGSLLPCDPKSRTAVVEISHASDVRLLTLEAYLKAAAGRARADTEAAKQALAAQAALAGGWNTEHEEADQERASIEAQIADLKESMRK